jgi:hypothetical protein
MITTLGLAACGGGNEAKCAEGETECGDLCLDLAVDIDNCGACGTVCAAGQTCSASACTDICAAGQQFCGGGCVDPGTDPAFCGATDCAGGAIGEQCANNYDCVGGGCECNVAGGYTECGPNSCVDLTSDINNCGTCGTVCETANGASCIDGICRAAVTYAGTLPPQNGRWDFGGEIGLPAGDAQCEANWPNSTVCTSTELVYAGLEGQLFEATDTDGAAVASWWNNDDEGPDTTQCVFTTGENVRWSYQTGHVGNGGSYYSLLPDGTLDELNTSAVCGDTHAVACCYRAVAIE